MPMPTGTYSRTGPPSCGTARSQTLTASTSRPGAVCQETVYTLDADDVTTFQTNGPSLDFSLRLNSMYGVFI